MMQHFIFINDQALIECLREAAPEDEFLCNVVKAGSDYFKEDGWLVYEPWLMRYAEFRGAVKETRNRNLYEIGDPKVSYDDLCRYQKEFEEKHGRCDGLPTDSEVIEYHLALLQYCIDRTHGAN